MRFIPCILAAALLLGGCVTDENPPPADSDPGSVPSSNGSVDPEDVSIAEAGEITPDFHKEWTWRVDPGFKSARVEFVLSGPQGSTQYALTDFEIRVKGPGVNVNQTGGTKSETAHPVVHLDSSKGDTFQPGDWLVRLKAGGGAAHYRLNVAVNY